MAHLLILSLLLVELYMANTLNPLLVETTCGSLLQQLQIIWDEVGESDEERDRMLLQLELECLEVYRKKVEQASKTRTLLLQSLADSKAELAGLLSALGENSFISFPDKSSGTIKEQLADIAPLLEQLSKKKEDRIREFTRVQLEIEKIRGEITGTLKISEQTESPRVDEDNLSLKKLDEFHAQLQELEKEKSDRLHKVLDLVSTVQDLCAVLGLDFFSTITEVHPSLNDSIGVQSRSISDVTLSKLSARVLALKEDKKTRLQKLQELASQLTDLWNLMDTPIEEQSLFDHVTCNISATVDEVTAPGAVALDLIEQAEAEVETLDQLKASKMTEIAFKKQTELEAIYARTHIEIDSVGARDKILALVDSGTVEPSELLAEIDNQILRAKEEAISRKEILEKVEKWISACREESWLEEYNTDENRYNSSRGAHLNLKRAEKARLLVNKTPALVDTLIAKTRAWEDDRGLAFIYDGVSLLAMLDEYTMSRQERDEMKRRQRDQKRIHERQQLATEQEIVFGSRRKVVGPRANGNGTPNRRRSSLNSPTSMSRDGKRDSTSRPAAPGNCIVVSKEDVASQESFGNQSSASP
ncbi:65-kDa microtubule-associated protein 1-like [Curcuma longa]|uniref:65-kDa microtubule-associated protein 1-like n=1 Tax=Curcuma longa TaxID=136217 RepID=UPI003D9F82B4